MTRLLLTAATVLATAGAASAQFQQPFTQYPQPFQQPFQPGPFYQTPLVQPNIFNSANQPLSPYLNLLRGGNQATNYYYGVRPGTIGGTGLGLGAPFTAVGGNRPLFFPQLANAPEPLELFGGDSRSVLPPAGHSVVFNNTLGYFPSPFGQRGQRGGLSGVGMGSAPTQGRTR
jgi:hypothetical protein